MQAINSNITQEEVGVLFAEYENQKMIMMFEKTKENKDKLEELKQKLIDLGFEEEVNERV